MAGGDWVRAWWPPGRAAAPRLISAAPSSSQLLSKFIASDGQTRRRGRVSESVPASPAPLVCLRATADR